MTNAELIEFLQKFPPEMRVIVDGYEGGFTDLTEEKIFFQDINVNAQLGESWVGEHDHDYGDKHYDEGEHYQPERVLRLSRDKEPHWNKKLKDWSRKDD